jgi:U4/U6.U5 tri-snRNP-associated protein 2
MLSNVTLDSTIASTQSKGTGPGITEASLAKRKARNGGEDDSTMTWKIHQRAGRGGGDSEKWFEMQDLRVEEVRKEMVFLGESFIQVWQRRDLSTPSDQPTS